MSLPKVAVLLANLGTPDAPTPQAVKAFLREFLSDPRVIEVNPLVWKFILNVMILPRRSTESAKRYAKIWTKQGSPLIVHTKKLVEKLSPLIDPTGEKVLIDYGMRYGNPSIAKVLPELRKNGVEKVLIVPLYPQYSATTTGTVMDLVSNTLKTMQSQPEIRTIENYYAHPAYIDCVAQRIKNLWQQKGEPPRDGRLVFAYHGLPVRYCKKGDPYQQHVEETSKLIVERSGIDPRKALTTYQSRFGNDLWLEPYTNLVMYELGKNGVKRIDVVCPGFATDCIETLEEVNIAYRNIFMDAGGSEFNYIPCLNSGDDWAKALAEIITPHLDGWI